MERIIVTLDDDGSIEIMAETVGEEIETMTADSIAEASEIVQELLTDAMDEDLGEDDEMEEPELLAADDEIEEDELEEGEKMWNEEASKRAKNRALLDARS